MSVAQAGGQRVAAKSSAAIDAATVGGKRAIDSSEGGVIPLCIVGDKPWQTVGALVTALATDTVRVQQLLDAATAVSREQFAALLAAAPAEIRSLLLPLAPPGLVVTEHHITCTLRTASARSVGFSLLVAPIHLGYAALYDTTTSEQCKLSVEVRATPSPISSSSKH